MDKANDNQDKTQKVHDMMMKLLQNPSIIKENVQKLIDEEKELYSNSISEAKELFDYVLSNWKSIAPPLAAIGLSVLLSKVEDKTRLAIPAKAKSKDHLN